jgi:predicted DNA-binding transcriptional regulator AlpA
VPAKHRALVLGRPRRVSMGEMAAMSDDGDRLMGRWDLAEYLRISPRTVDSWREKDFGPPFMRVGMQIRYRKRDVDAWLETTKSAAAK